MLTAQTATHSSDDTFLALFENSVSALTAEEISLVKEFQKQLDNSRMQTDCDCSFSIRRVTLTGANSTTFDNTARAFFSSNDLNACGPFNPFFGINASTNGCLNGLPFVQNATLNLSGGIGSVSPGSFPFNCVVPSGSTFDIRGNTQLEDPTDCTADNSPPPGAIVEVGVSCFDVNRPSQTVVLHSDETTMVIPEDPISQGRVSLGIDNNCEVGFLRIRQ